METLILNKGNLRLMAQETLLAYNEKLLPFFEEYGERYRKVYLYNRDYTDENLRENPYLALEFFLRHSLYRGRPQELSDKIFSKVSKVLSDLEDKAKPIEELKNHIESLKIPKPDEEHIISLTEYMRKFPENYNIYNHIKGLIEESIEKAYMELDGIEQVGEKIASFILRDVILVAGLELKIENPESIKYIFPQDTHVKKVLKNYFPTEKFYIYLFQYLNKNNKNNTLTVAKIASGMWYAHYHAFDILMEVALYSHLQPNFSLNPSST